LPSSVGHEACDVHFSHSGVDNRHAGLAIFPSLDELHVGLPAVKSSIINTISTEALVAVSDKPKFVEIAPEKLRDEVSGVRAVAIFGDVLLCGMVHLSDGERAVSQPRRKFTRKLRTNETISSVFVVTERIVLVEVFVYTFESFGFATNKWIAFAFVWFLADFGIREAELL